MIEAFGEEYIKYRAKVCRYIGRKFILKKERFIKCELLIVVLNAYMSDKPI